MKKQLSSIIAICALFLAFKANGQNIVGADKSKSGQTVQVAQDQVLEIKLPKRPSTGYVWVESATSADRTIQRSMEKIGEDEWISDPTPVLPDGRRMVGQSGTQIIRYVGAFQGNTVLSFELKRPWEKNTPPMDFYTITVVSGGKYTGSYTPPATKIYKHKTSNPVTNSIPARVDWRSQCTPIENQENCGDCWAYATVGAFECNIKIIDNVTRDLSEEFITDCYTLNGSSGCNGGECAFDCWLSGFTTANPQGGGAVYETDDVTTCNNTGKTGTCGAAGYPHHETITSDAVVPNADPTTGIPPDADIKNAIYTYGPVWMAFDASSNAFNNYTGGILTESGTDVDHAVVFVGYVDSAAVPGGGYWIVRNSWGSSWGLNGYFYLSYGSDDCGTNAEYLVYKGGIPYTVPPIAAFGAALTSSCSSVAIQFNDSSTNSPTSWFWTFGDGGTSTLQNPSHSYTSSGSFAVSLLATNSYGNNTMTRSSYITINLAQAPIVTSNTGTSGSNIILNASGTGTIMWYDSAKGGILLGTGPTYSTPALSASTIYYVENDIVQPVQSVGMLANTTNGGYYTSTAAWGLIFDALNEVTINTVDVYAGAAETINIWLKNSAGTTLGTTSKSLVARKQTVSLNYRVPLGTGYELGSDGDCNLWRETTGAAYPYSVSNLISITGNPVPDAVHYYYFYNWQVEAPSCTSARVPVTARISLTTGINESSETSNLTVYPVPASGSFDIISNNINIQNATLTIMDMLGKRFLERRITDNNPIHIDASGFAQGMYLVEVTTDKVTYIRKVTVVR